MCAWPADKSAAEFVLKLEVTLLMLSKEATRCSLKCLVDFVCRGGVPSEEEVQAKKDKLASILKQHDITVKDMSSTHLWQYYPPFAPNWLRLQEVLLPIEAGNGQSETDEPHA